MPMSAGSSIQLWFLNSQGVTTQSPPFPFQRKKRPIKAGRSGADTQTGLPEAFLLLASQSLQSSSCLSPGSRTVWHLGVEGDSETNSVEG